jgi:tRNA (cytidine/uridine-2'-O-)-methyltransferase
MTPDLHVVLVEPEIHWNAGNVGRTCLAVGAQLHLVEPLGFSLDEKQVRRAGLDYWEHVRPRVWPSFDHLERQFPTLGEPFFFCPGADKTLWDASFSERTLLLFGRESQGFSDAIRARYRERLLDIPMRDGRVRALNLSTCVGIAVYEVLRQRRPQRQPDGHAPSR